MKWFLDKLKYSYADLRLKLLTHFVIDRNTFITKVLKIWSNRLDESKKLIEEAYYKFDDNKNGVLEFKE
jgi:hypothetical protein